MPAFVAHPVSLVEDDVAEQLEDCGGAPPENAAEGDDVTNAEAENKAHRGRGEAKAREPLDDRLPGGRWSRVGAQTPGGEAVDEGAQLALVKDAGDKNGDTASAAAIPSKESILERFRKGWRSKLTGDESKVETQRDGEWGADEGWGAWCSNGNEHTDKKSWQDGWGGESKDKKSWQDGWGGECKDKNSWKDGWGGESKKDGEWSKEAGDKADRRAEKIEEIPHRLPCAHPRCNFLAHTSKAVSERYCCKRCEAACDALEPAEHGGKCEGTEISAATAAEQLDESKGDPPASDDRRSARGEQERRQSPGRPAQKTSRNIRASKPSSDDSRRQPGHRRSRSTVTFSKSNARRSSRQPEHRRSYSARSFSNSRETREPTKNGAPIHDDQFQDAKGRPPDGGYRAETSSGRRNGAKKHDGTGHRSRDTTSNEKGPDWNRADSSERRHLRKADAIQDRRGADRREDNRRLGPAKGRSCRREESVSGDAFSSRSKSAPGHHSRGHVNGTTSVRQARRSRVDDTNNIPERELREMALRERALLQLEKRNGRLSKRARPRSTSRSEECDTGQDDDRRGAQRREAPGKRRRNHDTYAEDVQRARRGESRRERESLEESRSSMDSFEDGARGALRRPSDRKAGRSERDQ